MKVGKFPPRLRAASCRAVLAGLFATALGLGPAADAKTLRYASQDDPQTVESTSQLGMVLSGVEALAHGQGALVIGQRPGRLAQRLQYDCQVVETVHQFGVVLVGVEAFAHAQGALQVRQRPAGLAQRVQELNRYRKELTASLGNKPEYQGA